AGSPGAGRQPALGPAAEGRLAGAASGGGGRRGPDPAGAARSAFADTGTGIRTDRPARSGDGGRAAEGQRAGRPVGLQRALSKEGQGTVATRLEERKESREGLKAALGRQPVVAAVDL